MGVGFDGFVSDVHGCFAAAEDHDVLVCELGAGFVFGGVEDFALDVFYTGDLRDVGSDVETGGDGDVRAFIGFCFSLFAILIWFGEGYTMP